MSIDCLNGEGRYKHSRSRASAAARRHVCLSPCRMKTHREGRPGDGEEAMVERLC